MLNINVQSKIRLDNPYYYFNNAFILTPPRHRKTKDDASQCTSQKNAKLTHRCKLRGNFD